MASMNDGEENPGKGAAEEPEPEPDDASSTLAAASQSYERDDAMNGFLTARSPVVQSLARTFHTTSYFHAPVSYFDPQHGWTASWHGRSVAHSKGHRLLAQDAQ